MENIAIDQAKALFEIQWRQELAANHGGFEVRRVARHGLDHKIAEGFAFMRIFPVPAIGKLRCDVLHKEARDMLSLGCERIVER